MDKICPSLNPNLEVDSVCSNWFRSAFKHCMDLVWRRKSYSIWRTIKNYFFPENYISVGNSDLIPISLYPQNLNVRECEALFMEILNDYIVKATHFAKESEMNIVLWQLLFAITGAVALGHIVMGLIILYYKYKKHNQNNKPSMLDTTEIIFRSENCMRAVANRSLRLALCELRLLKVKCPIQKEDLLIPDGSPVLVICVNSKLQILDNVVMRTVQSVGRLYKAQAEHIKNKTEFKKESITKALSLLDRFPRKLRFALLFDESSVYEELLRQIKEKNVSVYRPRTSKNSTTPIALSSNQRLPRGGTSASSKSNFTLISSHPIFTLNNGNSTSNRQISPRKSPCTNTVIRKCFQTQTNIIKFKNKKQTSSSSSSALVTSHKPMSQSLCSYQPTSYSPRSNLPISVRNKKTSLKKTSQ